jgi:DNA (cytosine-5)-methyltransferase 1
MTHDTKHNGLWVVSTFAGCGGSSLGWRQAGFRIAAAVEWSPEDGNAAEAYRLNAAPDTEVVERDICDVTGEQLLDIVEAKTGRRELDVLDGSPPCPSWSRANPRRQGLDDERGELFSEYVGLVEEMDPKPRCIVAENVEGLTDHRNAIALYRILRQLRNAGYSVQARVLRGERLGVPQTRSRLIVLGFREGLSIDATDDQWWPRESDEETTIADVLPDVARIIRRMNVESLHPAFREDEPWPAGRAGPTITKSGMGYGRQDEILIETNDGEFRQPTTDDLLALSTFPEDFELPDELEPWARLGNSVPPAMMRAVAERVAAALSSSGRG